MHQGESVIKLYKAISVSLILIFACCFAGSAQKVRPITLDELYKRVSSGGDTTYVINFWATWCGPCVKELPGFDQLSEEYKNEKLKVLLINLDFKSKLKSSVIPFLTKTGIKNEVFQLDEPDAGVYINRIDSSWSGALPATLMIRENNRMFYEKDFTYGELLKAYQKFEIL